MTTLRPTGEVLTFPIIPADQAAAVAGQMHNIYSMMAERFGTERARELFTQAACAEIARQGEDTGNLLAHRFAVDVLMNQAFDCLPDALPVDYAG